MLEKRYLTNGELREIRFEEDMLQGNINRMCVCNDSEELIKMRDFARARILKIYEICCNRFLESEVCENDNR